MTPPSIYPHVSASPPPPSFVHSRYGADPRDPPTREALAKAEGRTVEGVAKEDVSRDAAAIGELIETVLSHEKEVRQPGRKLPLCLCVCRGSK